MHRCMLPLNEYGPALELETTLISKSIGGLAPSQIRPSRALPSASGFVTSYMATQGRVFDVPEHSALAADRLALTLAIEMSPRTLSIGVDCKLVSSAPGVIALESATMRLRISGRSSWEADRSSSLDFQNSSGVSPCYHASVRV